MPLNNPTTGNESQFNPTKPIDSGKNSYAGYTFNILPDVIYLSPLNKGVLNSQFTPTKPIDSGKYSYQANTFNIKLNGPKDVTYGPVQFENFLLNNPTIPSNKLVKPNLVSPLFIKSQFSPTKPIDNGSYSYSKPTFNIGLSGPIDTTYGVIQAENFYVNNPTLHTNILVKPKSPFTNTEVTKASILLQYPFNTAQSFSPNGTFNLKEENLTLSNPTNIDNTLLKPVSSFSKTEVSKDSISNQYPFTTAQSFSPTGTFDLKNEKLTLLNPTNADNTLLKPVGDSAVTFSTITSQFMNVNVDGTNTIQLMFEDAVSFVGNIPAIKNLTNKSSFLSYLGAFGKLDKNVSHSSFMPNNSSLFGRMLSAANLNIFNTLRSNQTTTSHYSTLQLSQLHNFADTEYADFRNRRRTKLRQTLFDVDLPEGESSDEIDPNIPGALNYMVKGQSVSDAYKEASKKIVGVYNTFNVERTYGVSKSIPWDNPSGKDITSEETAAYGDKVTLIKYGKKTYANVYTEETDTYGYKTKDFIKFFFTGPSITTLDDNADDVMVFRAIISSLSDTFNPSWTEQRMIGRADPNYHYTGYSRDVSVDFTVIATDRNELKFIWQKLNALAGYTTPTYDGTTLKGPWMRVTIGDLFVQQPALINSLSYTLHDSDTTWEINVEGDTEMMQVPKKVSVSMGLHMITDYIPRKNGTFYTLGYADVDVNEAWVPRT